MTEADYQALLSRAEQLRSQLEQRAERRYEDTVDYFTVWAHQIKTPIASMALQLQSEDTALSRSLSAELGTIERYVEMAMAYQRLDGGMADLVIREQPLDPILRSALRRLSGDFIRRGLTLHYAPTGAQVVTDAKWLSFVVEQVLSNALKYTPSGSISITMQPPLTLCIRDTGVGIAPEDLPRIFERGYTGRNGRLDRTASGLGLYLCRRVCERLNIGIRAESRPGVGTALFLALGQTRPERE